MTINNTLSIPGALRTKRPDDHYENAQTIDWPDGADGEPMVLAGATVRGVVFADGEHRALAEEFVRFLLDEGWLAHWLTFAGDRYTPPMRSWSSSRSGWMSPTRIACARRSRS